MSQTIIIVQNLRVGGFQRIALDEAYSFSESEQNITLVLLEELCSNSQNNFYLSEFNLINKLNIEIKVAKGSRLKQFLFLKKLIGANHNDKNFISHSLRATVLIRLASFCSKSRANLITIIHQLPAMSAPVQRVKRFFYSLFSNFIFTFSEAARLDWNMRVNSHIILKFLFRKKPLLLLRNGVFLGRINNMEKERFDKNAELRLVFLGRPTAWKGVSSILELAQLPDLVNAKLLFFFPYENADLFKNIPVELTERISVVVGKSFKEYKPSYGDVHLYPANYGTSAKFTESISINCLEMASVGIPSFITKGGLLTWPEFLSNPLFVEVDWSDTFGTARKINDLYKTKVSDFELSEIKQTISVNNHVNKLQDYMI